MLPYDALYVLYAFEEAKDFVSYCNEYNIFRCTQINRSRRMRQVI